jgi:hypothetical protein
MEKMSMRQVQRALATALFSVLIGCPPPEDVSSDAGGSDGPVVCGPTVCEQGQVCCNESCGICTEPSGFCTEQFCGDPSDDPCAVVRCAAGTHCEVVENECTTKRCDPTAQCVPDDVYGCELIDCRPGYTCVEDAAGNGSCVAEGTGVACGSNTCAAGEVCCNASCGICTPPDGACIQIACEPEPTCDLACEKGSHCELVDVVCVTTPCNPVPECVADECTGPIIDCAAPPPGCHYEGGGCVAGSWTCGTLECGAGCELLDCAPGFACIEDELGNGECVPDGASSCAATLCPVNTYCDDISGRAECLPLPSCDGVRCGWGKRCELQQVQCIRAPCPPQPTCVSRSR